MFFTNYRLRDKYLKETSVTLTLTHIAAKTPIFIKFRMFFEG